MAQPAWTARLLMIDARCPRRKVCTDCGATSSCTFKLQTCSRQMQGLLLGYTRFMTQVLERLCMLCELNG